MIILVDDDDVVICLYCCPTNHTVIYTKFSSNNPSNSQYFRHIQLFIAIYDIDKRNRQYQKNPTRL